MTRAPDAADGGRSGLLDDPGTSLFFAEVAFRGDTHRLARLLVNDLEAREKWSDGELGSMLAHQLGAPLDPELARCALWRSDAATGKRGTPETFRDVLFGGQGSVDALRRVKEYAKAHLGREDSIYPVEMSRVLYYGSVMAARRVHGERITSLSDAELRRGVGWVLRQAWVDSQLREWFRASLEFLAERD
jgi:hypothetical protein